jgi:hypothetical protein
VERSIEQIGNNNIVTESADVTLDENGNPVAQKKKKKKNKNKSIKKAGGEGEASVEGEHDGSVSTNISASTTPLSSNDHAQPPQTDSPNTIVNKKRVSFSDPISSSDKGAVEMNDINFKNKILNRRKNSLLLKQKEDGELEAHLSIRAVIGYSVLLICIVLTFGFGALMVHLSPGRHVTLYSVHITLSYIELFYALALKPPALFP